MQRRLALLALPAFAGCGFQLRQPLSYPFRTIALTGFAPRSPLETELRRALVSGGVEILLAPRQAQVVLQALEDKRERSAVATTAAGQVREIQLRLNVTVRADTPAGRALMAPVEMKLKRDLGTTETATLAKEQEQEELFREMQADVVAQLLRRLAALQV
jgi:LPS-assembly lipoprotein